MCNACSGYNIYAYFIIFLISAFYFLSCFAQWGAIAVSHISLLVYFTLAHAE